MTRTLAAMAVTGCVAVSALLGAAASRGEDAADITAFSCRFETGYSWTYDNGKFQSNPPSPLTFDIRDINLDAQSAKLVIDGKPGGNLRIVRALNANHFLEVANEGFLNLTTIYDLDAKAGASPAVHSRHFGLLGQPFFAQYAGLCTPK